MLKINRKKISISLWAALILVSFSDNGISKTINEKIVNGSIKEITGSQLQNVQISTDHMTRITCSKSKISRPVISSDTGLKIMKGGNNDYFLKLPTVLIDGSSGIQSHNYDERHRDIFVYCGKEVFTLKLIPNVKEGPITIILNDSNISSAAYSTESSDPYKKQTIDLILSTYKEVIPTGYRVVKHNISKLSKNKVQDLLINSFDNNNFKIIGNMTLSKRLSYIGDYFIVEDWLVDVGIMGNDKVSLDEKMFASYFKNYRVIALTVRDFSRFIPTGRLLAIKVKN